MQVSDMDINAPSRILPSPHRRRRIVSLASLQCLKLRAINSLRTEASKTSYKRRFLCMSLPYNSFFYHNSQHCYTFLTHACFFHKKISYLLKKFSHLLKKFSHYIENFSQLAFFAGFFRIFYPENTQGYFTMLVTVAKSCMLHGNSLQREIFLDSMKFLIMPKFNY